MTGTESESPLVRYLRDPSLLLRDALEVVHGLVGHLVAVAPAAAGGLIAVLVARLALAHLRERRIAADARLVRVSVPPEVDASGALLLWSALHDLLRPRLARLLRGQPHLSWEIAASSGGTEFRLWIPRSVPPGLVERALTSAWPGTTIAEVERQPIVTPPENDERVALELVLSGPEWFPLGGTDGPDPLRLVLGQLAGLADEDWALVQVLARPATIRERRRLTHAARHIRAGRPPHRLARLLDLVLPGPPPPRPALDPTISPDVRAVLDKAAHPLYRCLIRIAVGADSREEARGRIHALAGAFAAYEGRVGLRRRRVVGARRKSRLRALGRRGFLLSIPELAALAHLPSDHELPGLLRAGARNVAPPPGLAADGKPLGRAAGEPVLLGIEDARYHLHLLGPTGVGKSTLLARLALADVAAGRGAAVIDPKGDLVEEILARVPDRLEDDVDLLDPLDPAPPGLNVLEGEDHELVVDQLVSIFHRVYEQFWGPRTDDILRAALLTLVQDKHQRATLADVPRLLTDDAWRREVMQRADDQIGLRGFWDWYEQLGEATRAQATGPVLNKLRAFLLRRSVRTIVGQSRSTIDIARGLDQGRLLLVKLPKGTLGEDTARLLGSFVVARIWQAALARAGHSEAERSDCALYVDEMHNFLNLPTPLEEMLAEARGYRLSLCLAHQHLAQLDRQMREALAANARTKIYFQLSPEDAATLERQVAPQLAAHDLANLPRYTAAVRVCRNGETGAAFTLMTEPLDPPATGRAQAVRERSRRRIGQERAVVEQKLADSQPTSGAEAARTDQRRDRPAQDARKAAHG